MTVIVVVFLPGSIFLPLTLTLALESLATALTTSSSTSESTDALYVVISGENAGESVPGLI